MNAPIRWSRRLRPVFLIAAGLLFASAALAQSPGPRIVGGQEADPGEWPWQVALVQKGANPYKGQFCGGTLIARDWVMTAAHCVDFLRVDEFDVVAGIHDLASPAPDFRRVAVAEIVLHPEYGSYYLEGDIALLRLAEPVEARPAAGAALPIEYAALVAPDAGELVGVPAVVTGWGNTLPQPDPGGTDYPERLHEVEVPIVSNDFCNLTYTGDVTDTMLCAGLFKGGADSCQGDSGGPLVIYNRDTARWEQAGIVSFGVGCGLPGTPGVYTRVSYYADWVRETTNPFVATDFAYMAAILDQRPLLRLTNGDFESGPGAGWSEFSAINRAIVRRDLPAGMTAHSGEWVAWLGGGDNGSGVFYQNVTVPGNAPVLSFYHWITSADVCGFDFAYVVVGGEPADEFWLCTTTVTNGWVAQTVDLSAYAWEDVLLEFVFSSDASGVSSWLVDDVSFSPGAR